MIYSLVLGDWSGDGHGKYEEILFECNYNASVIRQAYEESCNKLGISFDNSHKDYADDKSMNDRLIWTEFENNKISSIAYNILKENGCLKGLLNNFGEFDYTIENCAIVIMRFIALSMPEDFVYKHIEFERINSSELNVQFGYGLFDG